MTDRFSLTDSQVSGFDDMAEFMHPKNRPQFPRPGDVPPIKPERAPMMYRVPGLSSPYQSTNISITGAEQGASDVARNQAIKKARI